MRRIKAIVALTLALGWLPAVSCCLVDASGLLGKRDCCSKERSHPACDPGHCDMPCGALASASYLPQQSQFLVTAPIGAPPFDYACSLTEIRRPACAGGDRAATGPPKPAGHWQFTFRAALPPRAPSFAS